MSKFTPGPWRAAGTDIVKDYRGEFFKIISKPCGDYGVDEEMENALLIASAPEMLEALEGCLAFLICLDKPGCEITALVRKAIAKATGQT